MSLLTQAAINSTLNQLINETPTSQPLGAGADTMGECTAPVAKFYQMLGWPTPPMANDSANGWGTNFPDELAPHVTHAAYKAGVAYPEGTVMMWDSPHIAIVVHCNGSNVAKVFEQNADPDGSYPHLYNRAINLPSGHRATYVLIPKVAILLKAIYHTIVPGDTLTQIAATNKLSLGSVKKLNPVTNFKSKNYDVIYPGEKVRIK